LSYVSVAQWNRASAFILELYRRNSINVTSQIRGTLRSLFDYDNPEPSKKNLEGVETLREVPKSFGYGKEKVQTTNNRRGNP